MLPSRLPKKPRRETAIRSPGHRAWVRSHYCSVPGCMAQPVECAHVRTAANSGVGIKPGDDNTLSLCVDHHRESHVMGSRYFECKYKLDLAALAAEFWSKSPHRRKFVA